ncbi:MAG: DUF116 domain-containing protein [Calditerrivibrio sp.]|nr:DUF116 domain-containing protein [Calditerrivibrio sp.]
MNNALTPERKRIFIFFLFCTSLVVILFIGVIWYVSFKGLGEISSFLGMLFTAVVAFIGFFLFFSTLILVFAMVSGKQSKLSIKLRGIVTKLLFPIVLKLAKFFRIDKDKVIRSFIAVNNELVLESIKSKKINNLLILLPHCIQLENCELKVSHNILNCKKCGKCDIGDLAKLSEKYNLNIKVATGGTIARRIVKDTRPELIIAVACERDMLSGIQDTYPLPVIGLINDRPFGPCINTKVSVAMIEKTLMEINYKEVT